MVSSFNPVRHKSRSCHILPGDKPKPVADWVSEGAHREPVAGGTLMRLPLVHEDEALGCFEVIIPQGRYERMAHDVLVVVAQMLAPVLAATELSQDLASEVALRTRELEAQRNFVARIIDSLPVGLYVIDRDYRIRAWNRKREAGTQGVSREDALGRDVFDVFERGAIDLLVLPEQYITRVKHSHLPWFEDEQVCVVWSGNSAVGDALTFEQYMAMGHVAVRFGDDRSITFEEWFLPRYGKQRRVDVSVTATKKSN